MVYQMVYHGRAPPRSARLAHPAGDDLGDLHRPAAAGVDTFDEAAAETRDERIVDRGARVGLAEEVEHERDRADRADWARDALPGVLRGRAVDRLEHRDLPGMDVPRGGGAEAADERRAEVGEDVAEEVRRDDDVELLRLQHHPHRGGVDVHRVARDVGVAGADLLEHLTPELLHRDRVRLVDERHVPARELARALEGVADDPLDARPREAHLHARLLVRPAALAHAACAYTSSVFSRMTKKRTPRTLLSFSGQSRSAYRAIGRRVT